MKKLFKALKGKVGKLADKVAEKAQELFPQPQPVLRPIPIRRRPEPRYHAW
ncbi:hypothetical protein HYT05_05050 [Candidatus Kaiserbacteria bacterium]|nr:hypothetical protein [Candidatus Kaiserbacteria bacterium]